MLVEIPGHMIEEVSFNLGAGATRDGREVDTRDWLGSTMPDFNYDRDAAWPLLDLAIRPPGNVNVIVQYGVPTFPIAEPPVVTYSDAIALAVVGATWGRIEGQRLTARFVRIRVTDTSAAANNGIYLVWFVRGL